MPDPVTLKLLDKLKIMAEKSGLTIDTQRMTTDMGYAEAILVELGDTTDPDQGWTVMQLLQLLGLHDWSEGIGE
jgi:hypothetical protein